MTAKTNDDNNQLSVAHIASALEKLDAVFGITGGKSVDEFLDSLTLEADNVKSTMDSIQQNVKDLVQQLDSYQVKILSGESTDVLLDISSMSKSLKEIEDMVLLSKDVLRHVADSILGTSLVDSESVQAYSKLLESIHVNIVEFISIYRDKQAFVDKIRFALFLQQQKKDLMLYKHNLELEKMKLKNGPLEVDPNDVTTYSWSQEQITKMINEENNGNDE